MRTVNKNIVVVACCATTLACGGGWAETEVSSVNHIAVSCESSVVEISEQECTAEGTPCDIIVSEATRFIQLKEAWRKKIRYSSSFRHNLMQPEYWDIIHMNEAALPFIFQEMKEPRWADWLFALRVITQQTLGTPESNLNEVRDAWMAWGRDNGHLEA